MINERMRRPCTCQTSRAVMIGCQARGARCEARGARSMTGSKAAPEVPRGLVPCRLVMSRAPPTRAARHLCAGCVHRRRSSPHGLGCFTHSGAMRADMDTRIKMPVKMRVRCTVLRRSRTSVIHAHDPTPPRAPRATAHAHGATAAVGPRGRCAAEARPERASAHGGPGAVGTSDPVGMPVGWIDRVDPASRRIRFRRGAVGQAVQSVRRVITLYTFHYLVHTSVERRQELLCHGMAASECSGSTSKGCSIWTPISS